VIGHSLPRQPQYITALDIILTIGYIQDMQKKTSDAARLLGEKSVRVRRKKWGEKEFVRRMRAWGKLGGRPRTKKGRNDAT
jgi:esterase/lipase superfamily enzyme